MTLFRSRSLSSAAPVAMRAILSTGADFATPPASAAGTIARVSSSSRLHAPSLTTVMRSEDRVTPLELFFDLVFVLVLTQCTALMAADPTWEGLAQGLLVLGVMWWSWVGYAWLTSVVDPEEGIVRFAIFGAMAALLVVALCVPQALRRSRPAVRLRLRHRPRGPDRALRRGQPRRPRAAPLGHRPRREHRHRLRAARGGLVRRRRAPGRALGPRPGARHGRAAASSTRRAGGSRRRTSPSGTG